MGRRATATMVTLLLAATACGKGGGDGVEPGPDGNTQQGGQAPMGGDPDHATAAPQPATTTVADPNRPFGDDPVSWLDARFEVELPRSTAPKPAELPWTVTTPTTATAPDAATAQPEPVRTFSAPIVLMGRRQVFVGEASVMAVQCSAAPVDLCKPEGLRAPTGKLRLRLAPDAVAADGSIAAVQGALAARGVAGQAVWVLADRRLDTAAVAQALAAVTRAGGKPVAGTATLAGQLAAVFPDAAAVSAPAPATPTAGESEGAGPVPTDLLGVSVLVRRSGVTLSFARPAPHPAATPEILGSVAEALSVWAERSRTVAPTVTRATVRADADAPWEEVVRVVDALRDTCARAAKGTPCHDQRPLFGQIDLVIEAAAAATPTAP